MSSVVASSEGSDTLKCCIRIQWSNAQGHVERTNQYKSAQLRLMRNQHQQLCLEIVSGPKEVVPQRFELDTNTTQIHKKFVGEGKASISLSQRRCTVFMSNAPPDLLLAFLRTLLVKLPGSTDKTILSRRHLNQRGVPLDNISPVTNVEVERARRIYPSEADTPKRHGQKRKSNDNDINDNRCQQSQKMKATRLLSTVNGPTATEQQLNDEQQAVLAACLAGQNVFYTGSAGTGKSFLLRRIIRALPPDTTVATASTGVAACHIGGITLHQFAGIGTGDADFEQCCRLVKNRSTIASIWRRTQHLIIDEISMIDGVYFDKLERLAREVRRNQKPFGGIQLILTGDFLQLPPVQQSTKSGQENRPETTRRRFCFQMGAWSRCIHTTFNLCQVHRQTDTDFIDLLNAVRTGRMDSTMAQTLKRTARQQIEKNGILATRLCSHTRDAQQINEARLEALPGARRHFTCTDSPTGSTQLLNQLTPAPTVLTLKVGAQVMLLKNVNIGLGLVNGARGVVTALALNSSPRVQFRQCEVQVEPQSWSVKTISGQMVQRQQVPLQLAWAFSIHKSQGLTLDCVEMSLAKVFEAGQAYVALSRAQSLNSLRVLDFDEKQVWANPDVLRFYRNISFMSQCSRPVPMLGQKKTTQQQKRKLTNAIRRKPLVTIC